MSAVEYREYTLLCDQPGCEAHYGPFGVERPRAALRKLATKDGWAFIPDPNWRGRGSDYCPEHSREVKPDNEDKSSR